MVPIQFNIQTKRDHLKKNHFSLHPKNIPKLLNGNQSINITQFIYTLIINL